MAGRRPTECREADILVPGYDLEVAAPKVQVAAPKTHEDASWWLKALVLTLLCVSTTTQYVIVSQAHAEAADRGAPRFQTAGAVVVVELVKAAAGLLLALHTRGGDVATLGKDVYRAFVVEWQTFLLLGLPGVFYAFQNNLLYIALENLQAATAQILFQLRLLTTAVFSVLLLQRRLSRWQWAALVALMVGVAAVQLSSKPPDFEKKLKLSRSEHGDGEVHPQPYVGVIAVLMAVMLGGFGGTWFERMVKRGPDADLWLMSVQLCAWGILTGCIVLMMDSRQRDAVLGSPNLLLVGFTPLVWGVVAVMSFTGIITAIVVKVTSNLAKGFANSVSILLSAAVGAAFLGLTITPAFAGGAVAVVCAATVFALCPPGAVSDSKGTGSAGCRSGFWARVTAATPLQWTAVAVAGALVVLVVVQWEAALDLLLAVGSLSADPGAAAEPSEPLVADRRRLLLGEEPFQAL